MKRRPSPMRNVPFARAIRHLRYGLAMSQEQFAQEVACSVASLSAWENGETMPGKLAERSIRLAAADHGWTLDLQSGLAFDPVFSASKTA